MGEYGFSFRSSLESLPYDCINLIKIKLLFISIYFSDYISHNGKEMVSDS